MSPDRMIEAHRAWTAVLGVLFQRLGYRCSTPMSVCFATHLTSEQRESLRPFSRANSLSYLPTPPAHRQPFRSRIEIYADLRRIVTIRKQTRERRIVR